MRWPRRLHDPAQQAFDLATCLLAAFVIVEMDTDTLGAALRSQVDVVLAARRGPVSMFHSLTVPMAVVNALVLAVATARPEESLAALENMQRMRSEYCLDEPAPAARR